MRELRAPHPGGRGSGTPRALRPGALLARLAVLAACALAGPAAAGGRGADGVFDERTSSHFVLLQDVDIDRAGGWSGSVRFERQVLGVLEAGFDRLDDLLGLRPRRRLSVTVYDPAVFDAHFARLFAFPAAGFYGGSIRVRGAAVLTAGVERTLLHELVHAAWDAEAPSLALPAWLNEGLAEWFEARATGQARLTPGQWAALRRAAAAGELPRFGGLQAPTFGRLGAREAGWAYLYSRALVDRVARTRGEDDLRRVAVEIARTGDVERSFRRVTRAAPAEHDAALRRELGAR